MKVYKIKKAQKIIFGQRTVRKMSSKIDQQWYRKFHVCQTSNRVQNNPGLYTSSQSCLRIV